MLSDNQFRYVAEIISCTGNTVDRVTLIPDWIPALEWSHFEGIRKGRIPPYTQPTQAQIVPVWDRGLGAPYLGYLRVLFCSDEINGFHCDIPIAYFSSLVQQKSSMLVDSGKLAAGEQFTYKICAYRVISPSQIPLEDTDKLTVEAVSDRLEIEPWVLDPLIKEGQQRGGAAWYSADFPVFIPQTVLDEATILATQAGELETGGILVGRLRRDKTGKEVFLQITAQVPAKHTVAERASLKFTGETWAAATAAIELRGKNEQICGWHHSHPWFCKKCPPESQRVCHLSKKPFFSGDDCSVHRTVFSRAFHIALLLSFLGPQKLSIDCFGWREGRIKPRGFIVPSNTEA